MYLRTSHYFPTTGRDRSLYRADELNAAKREQPDDCIQMKEKKVKKVEIVIAPFKIKGVKGALARIGMNKITVSKVRSFGGQTSHTGYCRGGKYESKYEPIFFTKTKIELEVAEEDLEKVLGTIEGCTESAVYGDEKVFVYSLDDTRQLVRKAASI